MAHEYLLKAHIYPHTTSGDTPFWEYRHFAVSSIKLVTSRRFQKWCSSGVVSALLLHETIDFTGFSGTFQDTAVAHEKHSYHILKFSCLIKVTIHGSLLFHQLQDGRCHVFLGDRFQHAPGDIQLDAGLYP